MKKFADDVVVSSGHKNFHMLFTAAEMERRGRLSAIICGAYPSKWELKLLNSGISERFPKLSRFANRIEAFPHEKVSQCRVSEMLSAISPKLDQLGMNGDITRTASFHMYANSAKNILIKSANRGARIYHFRAGFGQESIAKAKELGMTAVCDHSIVHPSLVDELVKSKGEFPGTNIQAPVGMWAAVLNDIHQADRVIVNSDFVADTFRWMKFDMKKVDVAYLGVENKFLNSLPPVRNYIDSVSTKKLRFTFAGGVIPRKGIDELSNMMGKLANENRIELNIAGSLPRESAIRYESLLKDPRVKYHGLLSQTQLQSLLINSDIFIFPSRAEGSARVVFEAMAAGCAVICTLNAGSIVRDGVSGSIVKVNDNDSLIEAVEEALRNPIRFSEYGRNNWEIIRRDYTQSAYGERLEAIYHGIKD